MRLTISRASYLLILGAATGLWADMAAAQERRSDRAFSWDGNIAGGRWLYVRNLNGSIRVERGSGNRTEVTAEKRWRRGDPESVRVEMRRVGPNNGDVLICALWREEDECDESGYRANSRRWRGNDRNDVNVEFVIRVGEGVKLDVSSVNGGLHISGATSTVEANTVNGTIVATSTGGPVSANTVNGSIEVRMANTGDEDLDFGTVNGSIEVYLPENINAEIDMRTVNGSVSSDFPLTVTGRINPRHLRATVGNGGRRLSFSTVNGAVRLSRR